MLTVLKSRDTDLAPYAEELADQSFALNGNELLGPQFWCRLTEIGVRPRVLRTLEFRVEVPGCPSDLCILSRGALTTKLPASERARAIATGDSDFDATCLVLCGDRQLALDYLTTERRRFLLACLPGVPLAIQDGRLSGQWTMDATLDRYLQPLVRLRSLSDPPAVELPPAGWAPTRKGVGAAKPLGVWAGILGLALMGGRPSLKSSTGCSSEIALAEEWEE